MNDKELDGTIHYRDKNGVERKTWIPPEQMKEWVKQGHAKRLYKIMIKGWWEGIKEDYWELTDEQVKKFVDSDDTACAIAYLENGEPQYSLVTKKYWDKFDEVGAVLTSPNLTQEQKNAEIKKLIDG